MIRKNYLFVAFASLVLATSCSQDVENGGAISCSPISFHSSVGKTSSRAVETTTANLKQFRVSAFQTGQDNYMSNVSYTGSGSNWSTDAGTFYWPVSGNLNFYCYAPDEPGKAGSFAINSSTQKLTGFIPNETAAAQKDFIYAKAIGSLAANATSGLDINFQHALSEVSVKAKNSNTAYTVEVTGVRLGNIVSKGDFTFPSVSGSAAAWALGTDKATYTTTWTTANKLSPTVSDLDAANVPFMLIPQQLAENSKAASGSYIALKVKITMQGSKVVHNDWAYVALSTKWEMGKRYIYTLDFSDGAGQDKDGNAIISGIGIKLNVVITSWNIQKVKYLLKGTYNANSITVDPTDDSHYYGIDISRANTFWSNSDVGNAENVIGDNTEWTAEVIWQDIASRAINFCDASGNTVSGDTYNGKGLQNLYIETVGGKKGNVIVGIKKKGAGSDAYLWSWHIWLTDEPQLVSGFMDRNLGATSATPDVINKTYGLYYQFGRKDAFVPDIDIYDINGNKLQNGATVATGKATFAKAVNNPGIFYHEGSNYTHDWASPNHYTSNNWNDITNADGKTFFDPCPEGWRLPTKAEYSNFSTTTFTKDDTYKGKTYNGNFFPFAGYRSYDWGKMNTYTKYWCSTPINTNVCYYLSFDIVNVTTNNNNGFRANGQSVRCVQNK